MTRLDSAIRRLMAQRALLDWAIREVIGRPGLILELGLGNGRTYDHLRAHLPGRDIYVFERCPAAHPDCVPPAGRLIVGDIGESLPAFMRRVGEASATLIHADLGTGDEHANLRLAAHLSGLIEPLLRPNGLLLSDQALELPNCLDISTETGVPEGRYFVYRRLPRGPAENARLNVIAE
jgi:hypothetical protein